jgi:hypothetical protein
MSMTGPTSPSTSIVVPLAPTNSREKSLCAAHCKAIAWFGHDLLDRSVDLTRRQCLQCSRVFETDNALWTILWNPLSRRPLAYPTTPGLAAKVSMHANARAFHENKQKHDLRLTPTFFNFNSTFPVVTFFCLFVIKTKLYSWRLT